MDTAVKAKAGCALRGEAASTCASFHASRQELLVGDEKGNVIRVAVRRFEGQLLAHVEGAPFRIGSKRIHHIEVLRGAQAIAVLMQGEVKIYDDSFDFGEPLEGIRHAMFMDAVECGRSSTRLAVACKRTVFVFRIRRGKNAELEYKLELLENVEALTCVEGAVFIVTKLRYLHCNIEQKICRDLMTLPGIKTGEPLLQSIGSIGRVILMSNKIGILTDETGSPAGSTIALEEIPFAVADTSIFVCTANETGVHIYDCITSKFVQHVNIPLQKGAILAADEESGMVAVLHEDRVMFLVPLPLEDQVCDLIAKQAFEDALIVSRLMDQKSLSTSDSWLPDVQAEIGLSKLVELEFDDAVAMFKESKTFHPASLFPLFPEYTDSWKDQVKPREYLQLHGPLCPLQELLQSALYSSAAPSIIQKMLQDKHASKVDIQVEIKDIEPDAVKEHYLVHSKQAIASYLNSVRSSTHLSQQESECTDTLLAQLYLDTKNIAALEKLYLDSNACSITVSSRLEEERRFHALALFLRSRGLLSDAIELWVNLVNGSLEEALSDNGALADKGAPAFCSLAAKYVADCLRTSESEELNVKHVPWLLQVDWQTGMEVLTSATMQERLSQDYILELLEKKSKRLACHYMLHLIEMQGPSDPSLETKVALMLIDLSVDNFEDGTAHDHQSENSAASWARARLPVFLRSFNLYDAETVLASAIALGVKDAQVVVLHKLERHIEALQILALELGDHLAAQEYCKECNDSGLFEELFHMYLRPPTGKDALIEPAACLLEHSGMQLDPREMLEAIPGHVPAQQIAHILHRVMHAQLLAFHQEQIALNLAKEEHLRSSSEKVRMHAQSILVEVNSSCNLCSSRIDTSIFAVLPGRKVVCYRCYSMYMASSRSHQ